jgi:hypothetical protein
MVWLIALFIDEIKEFPDLHATLRNSIYGIKR